MKKYRRHESRGGGISMQLQQVRGQLLTDLDLVGGLLLVVADDGGNGLGGDVSQHGGLHSGSIYLHLRLYLQREQ